MHPFIRNIICMAYVSSIYFCLYFFRGVPQKTRQQQCNLPVSQPAFSHLVSPAERKHVAHPPNQDSFLAAGQDQFSVIFQSHIWSQIFQILQAFLVFKSFSAASSLLSWIFTFTFSSFNTDHSTSSISKSCKVFPAFFLLFLFTFSVVSSSSALLKSRHVCASKNLILFYCIYHSYILRISKKWRFLPMFFLLKFRADRIFYLK